MFTLSKYACNNPKAKGAVTKTKTKTKAKAKAKRAKLAQLDVASSSSTDPTDADAASSSAADAASSSSNDPTSNKGAPRSSKPLLEMHGTRSVYVVRAGSALQALGHKGGQFRYYSEAGMVEVRKAALLKFNELKQLHAVHCLGHPLPQGGLEFDGKDM